jgi:hypothetical protein
MEVKGTFIFGVKHQGATFREFSLEPLRLRDKIALLEAEEQARDDDRYFGLLCMSKQLRIPGIPQEEITPEFILDMFGDDTDELFEAQGRLKEEMARFRAAAKASQDDGPGSQETGIPGGGDRCHDRGAADGMGTSGKSSAGDAGTGQAGAKETENHEGSEA